MPCTAVTAISDGSTLSTQLKKKVKKKDLTKEWLFDVLSCSLKQKSQYSPKAKIAQQLVGCYPCCNVSTSRAFMWLLFCAGPFHWKARGASTKRESATRKETRAVSRGIGVFSISDPLLMVQRVCRRSGYKRYKQQTDLHLRSNIFLSEDFWPLWFCLQKLAKFNLFVWYQMMVRILCQGNFYTILNAKCVGFMVVTAPTNLWPGNT